ncbi:MAG: ComF family protein [Labrys sp. (in: a-proteobacteria)]|jgi:ComF family protein
MTAVRPLRFPVLARGLRHAGARLVDWFLPPACLGCQAPTQTPHGLCPACWSQLPLIERPFCERLGTPFSFDPGDGLLSPDAIAHPPAYHRARAATRYAGLAVELVHRLKYSDRDDVAPLLGSLMARAGSDLLSDADALIPIPLHRWRLLRRRFNQSALLCDEIARLTGVPHDPFTLQRVRRSTPQVGLSRAERLRNVQGAFTVPEERRVAIAGRRLVLVDDVVTSGATAEAATRTLLRAGAARVDLLSFARVIVGGD